MRDRGPILVPLDGSELSEGTLPYATAMAKALGERLVLLTVWAGTEEDFGSSFPAMVVEVDQKAQAYYTEYLDGVKGRLGGVESEPVICTGEPVDEILRVAEEKGARMIAMSTHGRSGIGRWFYGSVAGHVLRNSEVPVLAIGPKVLAKKQTAAVYSHVMVPLDGSPASEAAIPVAKDIAAKAGAKMSLVRVVNWAVQSYPYTLPDAYVPQIDQELEAGAKEYLRRKESEADGANVSAFVIRGSVADGLMEFQEKESVDLMVMTTHARSGLARVALGSVADRMLQGSAPVLMIRPE